MKSALAATAPTDWVRARVIASSSEISCAGIATQINKDIAVIRIFIYKMLIYDKKCFFQEKMLISYKICTHYETSHIVSHLDISHGNCRVRTERDVDNIQ